MAVNYVLNVHHFSPFLFSSKMLFIRAGTHQMLVRIINRKDPCQVCPVSIVLFGRQLMLVFLDHLP